MAALSIRMDDATKKAFDSFCNSVGMNVSTAVNIFARKVVREHRIPFEIDDDPFYGEQNMKALKKADREIKKGKVVVKTMDELEAMERV